ncbi:hypothetical protein D9M72_624810 [compost metagenome]
MDGFLKKRRDGMRRRHHEQCVAVGRRFRDVVGAYAAAGARLVFDDDGLPILGRHFVADEAGQRVHHASRRIGNNDVHRLAGEVGVRARVQAKCR